MKSSTALIQKEFSSKKNKTRHKLSHRVAFYSSLLSSVILIIALSMLDGYDYYLRESAAIFTSHIKIDYYARKSNIDDFKLITNEVNSSIDGKAYLVKQREVLVRNKDFVDGFILKSYGSTIPPLLNSKIQTKTLNNNELIISKSVADKLNLKANDKFIIYLFEKSSSLNDLKGTPKKVTIKELYSTGMGQYDNSIIFCSDSTLISENSNITPSIEVYLNDLTHLDEAATKLKNKFKLPFFVSTYEELHKGILHWINIQKKPIPIVLAIISVVAILNIITALIIVVTEKSKSIGILRTLGISNGEIFRVFLNQGLRLGLLGALSGCIIAFVLCYIQAEFKIVKLPSEVYFLDAAPIKIYLWHYLAVIGLSFVLSVVSTLIPAYFATKVNPIKAIKFNN